MVELSERQLKVIIDNPIKDGLDDFGTFFKSTYPEIDVHGPLADLERVVTDPAGRNLALKLIGTFLLLPAASALISEDEATPLNQELAQLYVSLSKNRTNSKDTVHLIKDVVARVDDIAIWTTVIDLIVRTRSIPFPTTPPRTSAPFVANFQQTPRSFTTGSLTDTSDLRADLDPILKHELGNNLITDHPAVFNAFFGGVSQLGEIAAAVFEMCKEAEVPLYRVGTGWVEWPEDSEEAKVLGWLRQNIRQFLQFANERGFQPLMQRRYFARPNKPIPGSVSPRKLDVGITYCRTSEESRAAPENSNDDQPSHWSDVLVPGELKSNPQGDNQRTTWLDLSRYAREIFSAQATRRFVVGFTLCGSIMRLWEFDRLGGVASKSFNIHSDGLMFISVVLGFLWMTEKELGFDPTICKNERGSYIEIMPDGQPEQLHLDKVLKRQSCVAGRATTCWKAYRDGDKSQSPFAIKDSWEDEERPEEGLLLKKLTEAGVENVAEYYYHETVCVGGAIDDIHNNIRQGLKGEGGKDPLRQPLNPVTLAGPSTPGAAGSSKSGTTGSSKSGTAGSSKSGAAEAERLMGRQGRSKSISRKRSASSCQASMPPSKRAHSDSPIRDGTMPQRINRVHRRLVMRRVGKSIYDASSLAALITGVLGAIKGHESSLERGVLHRDISTGNIMLEETEEDGFLIDFDLAIEVNRTGASGAPSKTGTKVFMAIGALYGEHHSFMHDLESFFWVLFWVCVHWNGPNQEKSRTEYESWNYRNTEELADVKQGKVAGEGRFAMVTEAFTPYCRPLAPCMKELHIVVFPGGRPQLDEDRELYSKMKSVLGGLGNA